MATGSGLRTAISALQTGTAPSNGFAPLPFGNISQNGTEPMTALESHWLTTKNGVQSIFNRVRILQGSMVIVDILDYNKLNRIMKVYNETPAHIKSSEFINEGIYDTDDWEQKKVARNFYASPVASVNPGQYWNVRLNTGFMEIDKYFPVKYTGQITIELYLETNANCLVSSVVGPFSDGNMPTSPIQPAIPAGVAGTLGTNFDPSTFSISYPSPTYTVSDVQAHVHFVVPIEDYDDEMLRTINEEGLTVMYSTWNQHTRQITSTGSQVISFQERSTSVRGGLAVMENNVDIGDIRNPDFQFSANNLVRFQWKMGNLYIPSQPVECENGTGRSLFELENFLGIVGNMQSSNLLTQKKFLTESDQKTTANVLGSINTTGASALMLANTANRTWENYSEMRVGNSLPGKFAFALNLDKSPGQLSGFNTSATNVDIELRFTLDIQNALTNMPIPTGRGAAFGATGTWITNQGTHIFQPSKFKCHDTTSAGDTDGGGTVNNNAFYASNQPDNCVFNGEGFCVPFYTAGEVSLNYDVAGKIAAIDSYPHTAFAGGYNLRPTNRFPDSGLVSATSTQGAQSLYASGTGLTNGGITSTSFMYTKAAATSVLITFYAYIDAQVSIMKVGQLEVLR